MACKVENLKIGQKDSKKECLRKHFLSNFIRYILDIFVLDKLDFPEVLSQSHKHIIFRGLLRTRTIIKLFLISFAE